jgi:hypothetical protein
MEEQEHEMKTPDRCRITGTILAMLSPEQAEHTVGKRVRHGKETSLRGNEAQSVVENPGSLGE